MVGEIHAATNIQCSAKNCFSDFWVKRNVNELQFYTLAM